MAHDLDRFVTAQDAGGTYAKALAELRAGRKRTHWMWFVFPQLAGLGHSEMAQRYAIRGEGEARAYLAHPVLGDRLIECASAVLDSGAASARELMGPPDDLKLRSSMTLFARQPDADPVFAAVLERYFDGRDDAMTVQMLGG
ncbi:DUF1810 domain-containing protein [Jatrophihabitans endophyticus]|uniref:DUF1810 domain-containing protein n=1 Tax=Jatrophihabitans endophyticus TaxID=1206085 RepID=UPI0019D89444|nr:DUF1810 domain-containing protein [Jatrophihabitans endophyticus]MBE7189079.1 DUF1810 domain-containing protein [Jatrophihabitans endophyticus]